MRYIPKRLISVSRFFVPASCLNFVAAAVLCTLLADGSLPNKYSPVRNYINDRSRYDEAFRDYFNSHDLNDFCEQLSLMFGWYVNPNSLGKSLKRGKK